MLIDPAFVLSGFAVGTLVGMTGVGGGSIMTPLLILMFGLHPAAAVGTDLLYAAATKTVGTAVHGLGGTVDWRLVSRLAAGSVPMTIVTLSLLYVLGADTKVVNTLITTVLAGALFATAVILILRKQIVELYGHRMAAASNERRDFYTIQVGAFLGLLVSISSVGAGAIGVTALILLYPRLPMARVVGSDIAHAVPLTLIAGIGHWLIGITDLGLLGSLLAGSVPGIIIGSYIAPRLPDAALRYLLAGTLAVVGGRLVL